MLSLCQEIDRTDVLPLAAFISWIERTFIGRNCFDFEYYARMNTLRNGIEWNQPGASGRFD